jgi:hypothetical protein
MKKVFLAAIIAFGFASCSTEDDTTPESTNSQFANVSAAFIAPNNLTGKNVNRGTIPVPVKDFTITTTNPSALPLVTPPTLFEIVASGATDDYKIEGVFGGINTFTATSTAAGLEISAFETILSTNTATVKADYMARVPYAIYNSTANSSNTNVNIVIGQQQTIPFSMTTNHGRLIVIYETGTNLSSSGYYVEVRGKAYRTSDLSDPATTDDVVVDISGTNTAIAYWSSASSVSGAHIDSTIHIWSKKPVYAGDGTTITNGATLIKSYPCNATVFASTGRTITFKASLADITESINTANFQWQTWTEQTN